MDISMMGNNNSISSSLNETLHTNSSMSMCTEPMVSKKKYKFKKKTPSTVLECKGVKYTMGSTSFLEHLNTCKSCQKKKLEMDIMTEVQIEDINQRENFVETKQKKMNQNLDQTIDTINIPRELNSKEGLDFSMCNDRNNFNYGRGERESKRNEEYQVDCSMMVEENINRNKKLTNKRANKKKLIISEEVSEGENESDDSLDEYFENSKPKKKKQKNEEKSDDDDSDLDEYLV